MAKRLWMSQLRGPAPASLFWQKEEERVAVAVSGQPWPWQDDEEVGLGQTGCWLTH